MYLETDRLKMNIGIEATALINPRGGGIHTSLYYALRELQKIDETNTYHVYTLDRPTTDVPVTDGKYPNWQVHRARGATTVKPIVWLQTGFNGTCQEHNLDVLWLTRQVPPLRLNRVPWVATIFDLFYLRIPWMFPWYSRQLIKLFTEQASKRSKRIVATSKSTARDVVELLGVAPEKIAVAYCGVDRNHFFPQNKEEAFNELSRVYGLKKPFILAVDAFTARKNFRVVLEAYISLPIELRRQYDIVATGNPPRHYSGFGAGAKLRELGLEGHVHLVGHVEDALMPTLYSASSLLVFPSWYEGFGLPIIEAMACGCPVVTSNISSMPEAAGDAALLIDPGSLQEIAEQVRRVLTDPALQSDLSCRGLEHCRQFPWSAFAEVVLDAAQAVGKDT
jgi:glycosyltransferase involved in cell wall biosynthesis